MPSLELIWCDEERDRERESVWEWDDDEEVMEVRDFQPPSPDGSSVLCFFSSSVQKRCIDTWISSPKVLLSPLSASKAVLQICVPALPLNQNATRPPPLAIFLPLFLSFPSLQSNRKVSSKNEIKSSKKSFISSSHRPKKKIESRAKSSLLSLLPLPSLPIQ